MWLSLLIIFVVVATSYWLMASYFALKNNVAAIQTAAKSLGNGDFSHQLSLDSKDEFGDIGESFKHMQGKVAELLELLQQDVARLRDASS